jgi:prepilin-type N-terminal cleavage/methylation domain-containing protein
MKRGSGFTLIELLVVIAIIGILASIVIASMNTARQQALVAKAKGELHQIRLAIEMLAIHTGQWPGHQPIGSILPEGTLGNELWDLNGGLAGLTQTDGGYPGWKGPYMASIPLDPWGQPYFLDTDYDLDGSAASPSDMAAVLGSFGTDGNGQNEYDFNDIRVILAH